MAHDKRCYLFHAINLAINAEVNALMDGTPDISRFVQLLQKGTNDVDIMVRRMYWIASDRPSAT